MSNLAISNVTEEDNFEFEKSCVKCGGTMESKGYHTLRTHDGELIEIDEAWEECSECGFTEL